jgi:hypothetical protein
MMRRVLFTIVTLAIVWFATPASAHVVEVTTSVALADVRDVGDLRMALKKAVDTVLAEAVAFRPTLLMLTNARVIGERLYVRLLIADEDGERDLSRGDDESEISPHDGEATTTRGRVSI